MSASGGHKKGRRVGGSGRKALPGAGTARSQGSTGSDKRGPQTIDHATGKARPTPPIKQAGRRIDLSTLRDVRLELAVVYRMMDAGQIPAQEATRRAYVLKAIGEIIELADLEKRIEDLEERGAVPALPSRTLN